jgi:hypothetical protein
MPYTITYSPDLPDIDEAVVTETVTNADDNVIVYDWDIPEVDEAVTTETVNNAADNTIEKTWEIPTIAQPTYAYELTYPRPGGKYATRATQQVLVGMQQQRHIFPLLPHRGFVLQWKFKLVLATDYATIKTGATGIVVKYSRDGEAFVTASATVTEIGFGWYTIAIPVEATNVNDTTLILMATATSCAQCDELIQFYKGNSYYISFISSNGDWTWYKIRTYWWTNLAGITWADMIGDRSALTVPTIYQPIVTETVELV